MAAPPPPADPEYEFLVRVEQRREASGNVPSASAVYRNALVQDGFRSDVFGAKTVTEMFLNSAKVARNMPCHGKRVMNEDGEMGGFEWQSYRDVALTVERVARSLAAMEFGLGTTIGVWGANSPEWSKSMYAINRISGVCVPLYETLGPDAVSYILTHAELKFVFVSTDKFQNLVDILETLNVKPRGSWDPSLQVKGICVWGDEVQKPYGVDIDEGLRERCLDMGLNVLTWNELLAFGSKGSRACRMPDPDDLCTIMYTSGTTGVPKGVMIKHSTVIATLSGSLLWGDQFPDLKLRPLKEVFLSFLPLAHIFERILEETTVAVGGRIGYWQGDVKKLGEDMIALEPTSLAGVPRVFEIIENKTQAELKKRGPVSQWVFNAALDYKHGYMQAGYKHSTAAPFCDWLVFEKVKKKLGGRVRRIVSGGAMMSPELEKFMRTSFNAVGVQGYGLTETMAATCVAHPNRPDMFGTVGPIQPCADFRLESVPEMGYDALGDTPRGELCIRGPCLFSGYYKNEEEYQKVMKNGFFHTGDIVELHPSGALKIIDRKKNLLKLSQGEYVAVERVEGCLKSSPLVECVFVHGCPTQRFPVAIANPNEETLMHWARSRGLAGSYKDICAMDCTREMVLGVMAQCAERDGLRGFETVRDVFVTSDEFCVENGLLTPTFKLKRQALARKFETEIRELYKRVNSVEQ